MMAQKKYFFLIVGLMLLFCGNTSAQSTARPKIGLTLSGGGAKGFAHVGILQALDSAGLQVDMVTGTSMGSVVGGLYAAGYSGDTIETIAKKLDWNLLFSTSPQLNAISIEEKDEFNKYALELAFDKGKFSLGTGIIEGQELWLKFAELFHPVYDVTDFSKLSIPFKCIGTDLSTGNAVVMGSGNIISCIRASMAIPSVFTPVQYKGMTVVDGGIVNNFPVLEAKDMGAGLVVGVNLNKGLDRAEDLESMFDILLQLAFFKDATYFEQHRKECDVYIMPELQGYSAGSFAASDTIIDIGKHYGRLYYPIFKKIKDSLDAIYGPLPVKGNRLPKVKTLKIDSYTVDGLKNTTPKFFFGLMGLNSSDTVYSQEKLAESIRLVYGSRYYKKINYDFVTNKEGKTSLAFQVQENSLTAIKLGFNYNTFTDLSLIVDLTSRDLLFKESRAMASVAVSENPRFLVEYYKYVGKRRRFGLNLSYYWESIDYPYYNDFDLSETLRSNYSFADGRIQYTINRNSYAGVSYQYNNSRLKTIETPDVVLKLQDVYSHVYLTYQLNNLDKKYFPTKGWRVRGEAGYVFGQDQNYTLTQAGDETVVDTTLFEKKDYVRVFIRADHLNPLNARFVLLKNITVGYLTANNPFPTNAFQLGGVGENLMNQVTFYGINDTEIKTQMAATCQLGLQWKVTKSVFLTGRANIGVYDFTTQASNTASLDKNFLSGYGLTLGVNSSIGPIEITSMFCDQDGRLRTYLNLGYRFLRQ